MAELYFWIMEFFENLRQHLLGTTTRKSTWTIRTTDDENTGASRITEHEEEIIRNGQKTRERTSSSEITEIRQHVAHDAHHAPCSGVDREDLKSSGVDREDLKSSREGKEDLKRRAQNDPCCGGAVTGPLSSSLAADGPTPNSAADSAAASWGGGKEGEWEGKGEGGGDLEPSKRLRRSSGSNNSSGGGVGGGGGGERVAAVRMEVQTRYRTRKSKTADAMIRNDAESEKELMDIAQSILDNLAAATGGAQK
ncbi:uncharacterized protein LOC143298033 [Babylonia areolata]|uniref:uncharacterized protein LOC143298033 n=1 Tax=Babylonia areolata TaxID=304850 RepID=UPI003FD512DC